MSTQQGPLHDKRDVASVFRERLNALIDERGQSLAGFAAEIGVDRSALSQFLAPASTRLPRAETLHAISRTCGVSLDWLLGLIASDETGRERGAMMEMRETNSELNNELLLDWHREATGYKIRYVPATLPDLLRTEAINRYEFTAYNTDTIAAKERQAREQLIYSRRPETDMEVCMPLQTLDFFAAGAGIWQEVPLETRRAQLEHMIALIDELYPTFRLFLYDERELYASAYTVFGPKRAAIYLGNLYLVVNAVDYIQTLTRHFDGLIRIARVSPDRAGEHIAGLLKSL